MNAISGFDVLELFERTRRKTPAYDKFLFDRGSRADTLNWHEIPLIDKATYISRYSLPDLFPDRRIAPMAHASSGSSGRPTYWFRGRKQRVIGQRIFAHIVRKGLRIPPSDRLLVVICFSMGLWVAGTYTMFAFEQIAQASGGSISVISPGIEVNDICSILKDVASNFDQVVLIGYPGFLDVLFERVQSQGIPLPQRLHLLTSGDKSSEEWRDATVRKLRLAGPASIVNIYGSSDGGLLAIETPLTIEIRRQAASDLELRTSIFGDTGHVLPGLFQYDPTLIHFEEIGGELVFTADLDLPLIRYNIHDAGRVYSAQEMRQLTRGCKLTSTSGWNWPFVVVSHRTDVAVAFYGLKIFPENIRLGISYPAVKHYLSGGFLAYTTRENQQAHEELQIDLELAPEMNEPLKDEVGRQIQSAIRQALMDSNIEYRKLHSTLGDEIAKPTINLRRYGELASAAIDCKHQSGAFLWRPGSKPRMLLA